ncbi:DNA cytosine methyltransferase [Streptomyces sp. JV180]|nr:DNA cytosine methyltransferase [Streptomyces sp. JV180]MBD3549829.1 DNA cytosine methyltransferase [Streptomyces sp. JV180]
MDLLRNAVDLFSGPRGWTEGMRALGISDIGLEVCRWACATAMAAGHATVQCDVTTADPALYADMPGLIASPPCRPWSPGGLRQGLADRELVAAAIDDLAAGRDPRATLRALCANPESMLAAEPMRWLYLLRPEWVCMEQVPAVLPLWQQYARHLAGWGYSVWTGVVDAGRHGVPQTRRRAVFIASRVRDAGPPVATHAAAPAMRDVVPGVAADTVLVSRRDSVARLAAHGPRRNRAGAEPAPTITGEVWRWKWDDHGAVRPVTDSEAGLLQTFPAGYPWQGPKTRVARQIGDAVPPALATAVVAVAIGAAAPAQPHLTAA